MREIKAIIQPFLLSKVINALNEFEELSGVRVSEVKRFGKARARDTIERVVEDGIDCSKKGNSRSSRLNALWRRYEEVTLLLHCRLESPLAEVRSATVLVQNRPVQ